MNILILSAGSRVKLVKYFKDELKKINGKIYVTDCSKYAPSLYVADEYFIVSKIDSDNYINELIDICRLHNIDGILSLIDPELSLISNNKKIFEEIGVMVLSSSYELNEICFNKFAFSKQLESLSIPTVKTYNNVSSLKKGIEKNEISFPVFVKPTKGSASIDIGKINNEQDLELKLAENENNYIIQEYIDGTEYGIDCFVDYIDGKIVDIFIKEKIKMRAGETDKSISVENTILVQLIEEFLKKMNLKGQLDIDVFEQNGRFLISEVNPRFGGGYPHAHESGCNFPEYIINNIQGKSNSSFTNRKHEKTIMMKYSDNIIVGKDFYE